MGSQRDMIHRYQILRAKSSFNVQKNVTFGNRINVISFRITCNLIITKNPPFNISNICKITTVETHFSWDNQTSSIY